MRLALYFTPPADDGLTCAAGQWLLRDPFADKTLPPAETDGLSAAEHAAAIADPQRYGFHATLKAPFELAASASPELLIAEAERFAAGYPRFEISRLVLGQLGPFFALVPDAPHPPLQNFAAEVVTRFEPFRAPLSESDISRRKPEQLPPAQREHLLRWGYPYVFEEFRFHMTLTGPIEESRRAVMHRLLEARFMDFLNRPLAISHLAVFVEEERGAPFTVRALFPLKENDPR